MFTIYGGKTEFNQWEQDQMITNPNMAAGDKVRFWNASGETHPMIAYKHDGLIVVDVPNDLLQRASPILVDLCGKPEYLTRFMVNFVSHKEPEGYQFIDNTHCEPVVPSGGGVSSWDDLKGKPFDEKGIIDQSALPEGYPKSKIEQGVVLHIENQPVNSLGCAEIDAIVLYPSEQYTVEYLGNVYTCVVQMVEEDGSVGFLLGNFGEIMGEEGTGEPFVIIVSEESTSIYPLDGSTSITMTITGMTEVIEELDKKYIKAALNAVVEESVYRIKTDNKAININFGDVKGTNASSVYIGEEYFGYLSNASTKGKLCIATVVVSGWEYTVGFHPFLLTNGSTAYICGTLKIFNFTLIENTNEHAFEVAFIIMQNGTMTYRLIPA